MKVISRVLSVATLALALFATNPVRAANVVDTVIDSLCSAAERCDLDLGYEKCVEQLNGINGEQIWDGFSLLKEGYSTAQVRKWVQWGVLVVSSTEVKDACLNEINSLCLREESDILGGDYANIENLIDDESVCHDLLVNKPLKNKN